MTAALVVAMVAGLAGTYEGWGTVAYYRSERPRAIDNPALESLPTESDRKWLADVEEAAMDADDLAQSRRFPIAVAELLIGMLLLSVAMRNLGQRPGSEKLLIQLVLLHGALAVAANVAQKGSWEARASRFETMPESVAMSAFKMPSVPSKLAPPDGKALTSEELAAARMTFATCARVLPRVESTFSGILALVLALTLMGPKSRDYFQKAAGVAPEV